MWEQLIRSAIALAGTDRNRQHHCSTAEQHWGGQANPPEAAASGIIFCYGGSELQPQGGCAWWAAPTLKEAFLAGARGAQV